MAFDAFLKIDGIPGESTDESHKDWIDVLTYDFGIQQPASVSTSISGGASAERAHFQDFSITKMLDRASPKLALACADGMQIKQVTLELCRADGDKTKYMEYRLSNCIASSYRDGGAAHSADNLPTETVSFNYGKIEWIYTQQKRADGSGGGQVAAGWDIEQNRKA
jgi:type VI secretion system secreted protein Hcp